MWRFCISALFGLMFLQTANAEGKGAGFFFEGSVGGNFTDFDEDYYFMNAKQPAISFDVDAQHGQIGGGFEFEVAPGTDVRFTGFAEVNSGETVVYEDQSEKETVSIKNGYGVRGSVRLTLPDQTTFVSGYAAVGVVEFCKEKVFTDVYSDYEYSEGGESYGETSGRSGSVEDCDSPTFVEVGAEAGRNFLDNKMDVFVRVGYRDYSRFETSFEPDFPERHEFSANGLTATVGVTYRIGTIGA